MLVLIVSGITCISVIVLLVVILNRRQMTTHDVGSAISETWVRLGLGQLIGRIELQAEEIRKTYITLEQMLRSPAGRGSFGELSLEVILADQLPPNYFGIREKCFPGKIPDAHIKSPDGLICIDSKFPLDNFTKMLACTDGQKSRDAFLKQFLKDTEWHLKKVADDYVRPDYGTAAFALVYIPSEAVYYVLITEGYDLLRQYIPLGVQVVSPLLLGHKLELLKLGIRALRLNENAQEVLTTLQALSKRFDNLEKSWQIFYTTHLHNLKNKASEIDDAYKQLHKEFRRISDDTSSTNSIEYNDGRGRAYEAGNSDDLIPF